MDDFPAFADVHQHWWPPELVELLAARSETPRIDGPPGARRLLLGGEAPYPLDEADHHLPARAVQCATTGIDLALQAPPAALGIEWLPRAESAPLFDAWHRAARELAAPFGWWAWTSAVEPDLDQLAAQLADGAAGIVVPAGAVPLAEDERFEQVLSIAAERNAPIFVHPGAAPQQANQDPSRTLAPWWPAMTTYVGQMQRAWYAWQSSVRPAHPRQRVVFALLAGLAPLHIERHDRRGAPSGWFADGATFFECSSYGFASVALLADLVGSRQILFGSDAPVVDVTGAFSARELHLDPTAHALGLRRAPTSTRVVAR